jgi:hypothetical protein
MAFGFLTRSMSVISAADLAIFANVLKSLMHRRVHAIALAPLRSPGLERPAITSFRAQRLQILERAAALQHQGDNLERQVVPRGHDLRFGLDLHVSSLRSSGAARAESPQAKAESFNCSRSMPPALRNALARADLPRTLPLSRESLRPEGTRDLFWPRGHSRNGSAMCQRLR